MGWIDSLKGKVVGIDTSPLIYFIEEHADYVDTLTPFFESVDRGDIRCVTSVVTLTEVLVFPLRNQRPDLARMYQDILLASEHITTLSITSGIAELAAEYRAAYGLRTPDAYQLAAAKNAGAIAFLTNDNSIRTLPDMDLLLVSRLAKAP